MDEPHDTTPAIELRHVTKTYTLGARQQIALDDVSLRIMPGEFVAIVGASGSGKSTILNMITGIDRPTSGDAIVAGTRLNAMSENRLAKWRGAALGIVFQFFQLMPTLTAFENVLLPMDLMSGAGVPGVPVGWVARRARVMRNLTLVGLDNKGDHLPSELSGGEQQRVAIARALANDPPILVADEPTGNLDSATGERIFGILRDLVRVEGKTVVYVTHDNMLAAQAGRLIQVRDGLIVGDTQTTASP